MDVSDYLPMFLAEGREHLQNLNLALVKVEQDRSDAETTNEIFRIAHSLKGMSATMGFGRMASLTHEMESVMETLRSRADGVGRPVVDALFACLDTLERMTDEIEAEGAETTNPAALVDQLRRLDDATAAPAAAGADGVGPVTDEVVRACEDAGLRVVRVVV